MANQCPKCRTTDRDLLYSSGKTPLCKDCKRFSNLKDNSRVKRTHVRTPELKISQQEFNEWKSELLRKCFYCGIDEASLRSAGLKSQTNKPIEALGLDRLDSAVDSTVSNIVYCCFACNKAKGNIFNAQEMKVIGKGVADVWRKRGIEIP